MKATFPLGRYAGVPFGAHWSVLVLADLLATRLCPPRCPAPARPRTGSPRSP